MTTIRVCGYGMVLASMAGAFVAQVMHTNSIGVLGWAVATAGWIAVALGLGVRP
jgi:hypothetical protein